MSVDALPVAPRAAQRADGPLGALLRFLAALRAAQRAALRFERLARLSDRELATRGLSRGELARAVLNPAAR